MGYHSTPNISQQHLPILPVCSGNVLGQLAQGGIARRRHVGRGLFPSNELFGQWVIEAGLSQLATKEISRDDRAAAMRAAANQDDFDTARAAGNARTVRGIHAK